MTTVSIIGAGELGGAIAHALARAGHVQRIVLIDEGNSVAAGKALDIRQASAVEGLHTAVHGTDDISRLTGCSVCVIADSASAAVEQRAPHGATVARVKAFVGDAPVVFAGADHADRLRDAVRDGGFSRERVMGSSPEAFIGAAKAIVALEARCAPAEISLTVLGAPPAGLVVLWSEAAAAGYRLERLLPQVQIRRLDERIARLWPPASHALGLAAARVVNALTTSARRTLNVLAVLDGEFGVRERVGILPARLGPHGMVQVPIPALDARERMLLETALGR